MQNLTPEQVFILTFCAAALSGVAVLLRSGNELSLRTILAAVLFYGSAGIGLGMIAFDWLGGKQAPWKIIGCGWLVGLKIIKLTDISTGARTILKFLGDRHEDEKTK